MAIAVDRLFWLTPKKNRGIFGDYDVDGVTSSALLLEVCKLWLDRPLVLRIAWRRLRPQQKPPTIVSRSFLSRCCSPWIAVQLLSVRKILKERGWTSSSWTITRFLPCSEALAFVIRSGNLILRTEMAPPSRIYRALFGWSRLQTRSRHRKARPRNQSSGAADYDSGPSWTWSLLAQLRTLFHSPARIASLLRQDWSD